MDKTIKAEDRAGNVIELKVKRLERQSRSWSGDCQHHKITVDPTLNSVHCDQCGKDVIATAWILMLADHWDYMRHMTELYRRALQETEDRKQCRCQQCGKVTKIVRERRNVIKHTGKIWT